jgi:hypothetical protein
MNIKEQVFNIVDDSRNQWIKLLTTLTQKTITDFGNSSYNEILRNAPKQRKEIKAFDPYGSIINAYIANYVRGSVNSITQTTKDQLSTIIENGNEEGLSVSEIKDNIISKLQFMEVARATTITRTTVVSASNYGSLQGAVQNELQLKKVWLPVRDDSTRETHLEMFSYPAIDLNDSFVVGDGVGMYPGDPNLPPEEFVNCRCASGYEYA